MLYEILTEVILLPSFSVSASSRLEILSVSFFTEHSSNESRTYTTNHSSIRLTKKDRKK